MLRHLRLAPGDKDPLVDLPVVRCQGKSIAGHCPLAQWQLVTSHLSISSAVTLSHPVNMALSSSTILNLSENLLAPPVSGSTLQRPQIQAPRETTLPPAQQYQRHTAAFPLALAVQVLR